MRRYQDLSTFVRPPGIRGRPAWFVQFWWIFDACLIRPMPQVFYGWRRFSWRLFGARIGRNVIIRPGVRATYPWKVEIGNNSWIGENVVLDSIEKISIGEHTVVSPEVYLSSATHDHLDLSFPIQAPGIRIGSECWVAARAFIGPGVLIEDGAVIGACSVVLANVPQGIVAAGNPARPIGVRKSRDRNLVATM